MSGKIIRRVHRNKNNKQLTVSIPKKTIMAKNPTIKFGEDLFVSIEVFNGKRK